ncbi:MAG: hypothetical protein HBSAPP04_17040 [Ignavibacteriaceae bacterium]|nr:MAG: HEPN domain-containing protein [Chlorobiota bacterium]GJQ32865.1 MAG: hypothetical protein HBSAPP04_17040 [Ignavibacteriaceae bacterium]
MVKHTPTKKVSKEKYSSFVQVADGFAEAAKVAREFDYPNAAGVLIIHSVIAYADALTIKKAGLKCKGENHYEVISLLSDKMPFTAERQKALDHFSALISHKNMISYHGQIYTKGDVSKLFKHAERFIAWAKVNLE